MEGSSTLLGNGEIGALRTSAPALDHARLNEARRVVRFGIICQETGLRQWQAEALRQLLALENTRIAVCITDGSGAGRPKPDRASSQPEMQPRPVPPGTRAAGVPRAMRRVGLASFPASVVRLRFASRRVDATAHGFSDADVCAIREHDLDFILYFGTTPLHGGILTTARHGVWSFMYSDGASYRPQPPSWWDGGGDPVTGAALVRLTEQANAVVVLRQGFLEGAGRSSRRKFDAIFHESARWPAQVCADLLADAAAYVDGAPQPLAARTSPTVRTVGLGPVRSASLVLWRRGREIVRKHARRDHWRVGVIDAPIQALLNPGALPPVRWLTALTMDEFLADPFGIVRDDKLALLCERFDYRTGRGTVVSIEGEDTGTIRHEAVAIGPDVHLSYPYLLEHDGATFCIPETNAAREIAIYRADPFPRCWVKVATLVAGFAGVDPTVFRHDGRWWLACTDGERGPNHNLYLWYAADLLGPWRPHPGNPVKMDIRSARPAGTPFLHDGALYRPAQDCSRVYGGRVVINRVTRLTPREFAEEPVAVVDPAHLGGAPIGIHTVSAAGSRTLVDGKWSTFRPRFLTHAIIGSLR